MENYENGLFIFKSKISIEDNTGLNY